MFRVNANGKRLDAWLIYKCTTCEGTWNRPVLERCNVRAADPLVLAALHANAPDLARRVAFDVHDLRRRQRRVEEFPDALVRKETLSGDARIARRVEIAIAVIDAPSLRTDRLLATGLGLSRQRVQDLMQDGRLTLLPDGARMPRKPVRHLTRVVVDLSDAHDRDRIASAAAGGSP